MSATKDKEEVAGITKATTSTNATMSATKEKEEVAGTTKATASTSATMSATKDKDEVADNTKATANVSFKDEESARRVRELGWVEPEPYNYARYNASNRGGKDFDADPNLPAWAASAAKYEWKDEYGDIGPVHEELERQLFRDEFRQTAGKKLDKINDIHVTVESETKVQPILTFDDAGLHPIMLQNVQLCGYKKPTPIQSYSLPAVLKGHDLIAVAQTGSGKTAAFLIPTLSKLMGKAKKLAAPRPNLTENFDLRALNMRGEPLILIICPTRELATQIFDEARRLCYRSMFRPCVAYGGAPSREQKDEIRKGCDILIATPGRLKDFMEQQNVLTLARVKFTIVDEADEMVSPEWVEDLRMCIAGGDNNEDADHIFMMFSATFPKEARAVAKEYVSKDHIRLRVGRVGSTHENIEQKIVFVPEPKKREALFDFILGLPPTRILVFVNGKRAADFLDDYLYNKGLPTTSIHSDRTQREREDAIRGFKTGRSPVLIATGISARGLDIKNVTHVVNFELPSTSYGGIQEYTHRIGRTARIGNTGVATSFYNEKDESLAPALVKLLVEAKQDVPGFLSAFLPEDPNKIDFEDDSDNEGEEKNDTAGGWGDAKATPVDDGWGSSAANKVQDAERAAAPGSSQWGTSAQTSATAAPASSSGLKDPAPAAVAPVPAASSGQDNPDPTSVTIPKPIDPPAPGSPFRPPPTIDDGPETSTVMARIVAMGRAHGIDLSKVIVDPRHASGHRPSPTFTDPPSQPSRPRAPASVASSSSSSHTVRAVPAATTLEPSSQAPRAPVPAATLAASIHAPRGGPTAATPGPSSQAPHAPAPVTTLASSSHAPRTEPAAVTPGPFSQTSRAPAPVATLTSSSRAPRTGPASVTPKLSSQAPLIPGHASAPKPSSDIPWTETAEFHGVTAPRYDKKGRIRDQMW